jgi:uncharacterized coiled-coil protein SlyX
MFGSKKNKIQVKSVEDYLRGEDARIPAPESKGGTSFAIPQQVKLYAAQGVVLLFIVALVLAAFSQLSTLKSRVTELEAGKEGEAQALKTQVGELAARLDKSNGQVALLTETVTALKDELEAEKAERARAEAAAVARRAANAGKKKTARAGR